MKSKPLVLFFSLLFFTVANGQEILSLRNFSDMKDVRSATINDSSLWAATTGGAFKFKFSDSTYTLLTKTEGLNGSPITASIIDSHGKIWLGSQDGTIDVYDEKTKNTRRIIDIANSGRTFRQINNFSVSGDTVFVSTDFGAVLINSQTFSFIDSYLKFSTLPSNSKVNYIFKKDRIFVATESGIAVSRVGAINLAAPESWILYTTANGLTSENVRKISSFRDSIIAATTRGVSVFDGTNWRSLIPQLATNSISDFSVKNDSLIIITNTSISIFRNGIFTLLIADNFSSKKLIGFRENNFFLTSDRGVEVYNNNQRVALIYPNGPEKNQFISMSTDTRGNLWVASGSDVTGVGFYKFDGVNWENFNRNTFPRLPSNSYFKSYSDNQGNTYIGNWGFGFIHIDKNDSVEIFTTENSPLTGIPLNPQFVVIAGLAKDSKGNLWLMNFDPADKKVLSVLTKDSLWYEFEYINNPDIAVFNGNLIIDQFDTKWYHASPRSQNAGLYFFNENQTLANLNDDRHGFINASTGLNSNLINCISLDKRGDLWVGTNLGVNIISNTNVALNNVPQFRVSSVFSLRQQSINAIGVDAINRKWVGTNQGLLLVTSDGIQILNVFNTTNSPLISDQIVSIAIDEENGIVYVGVEGGLTAFYTTSLEPVSSFEEINLYPSPFVIGDGNSFLTIDGLIKDAEIKLLSASGKLVRNVESLGGRIAFWDGKNNDGNFVNTGVYILVASDKEGNTVKTAKVAVIRK